VKVLAAIGIGTCCALVAAVLLGCMPRARSRRGRAGFLATRRERANLWLQQAAVDVGLIPFWAGSVFAGLFAVMVVAALTGSVFVAAVPGGAVALIPRAYFGRRRRDRLRQVQLAWPDALRDLVSSIAAGNSLTQAVTSLAETGPLAMRVAFARFPQLARVLGTGPALELMKEDLADPTSDRVLEVLILAQERGGAIVRDVLDDLVETTTRDLKLLDELETEGLEMRINAKAVVVLPWLVLVALTARPGAFRDFYQSAGGVLTLVVAGVLTAIGVAVLGRLGREPIETRILTSEPT
jgi:tight adherence protein B